MNINIPFPFPEEIAMEDILNALGEANQREMAVLCCAITLYGGNAILSVSTKGAEQFRIERPYDTCNYCLYQSACSICRFVCEQNIEFAYAPDAAAAALAALKAKKGQG